MIISGNMNRKRCPLILDGGFGTGRVSFFPPLFHMVSRNLKYGRELICYLSRMDVLLSDLLPEQVVSEWLIIALEPPEKSHVPNLGG